MMVVQLLSADDFAVNSRGRSACITSEICGEILELVDLPFRAFPRAKIWGILISVNSDPLGGS